MSGKEKSRKFSILELFLDACLLLCFIAQTFLLGCILIYGHLPLPTKLLDQNISAQLPEGVSIQAEGYALGLDGTIRIENIQLKLDHILQPVFTADNAHVELRAHKNIDVPFSLKEFVLSNGIIVIPAVYSPSGKDSTVLDHIALRLIPDKGGITIDSFAALHGEIRLRGSLEWASPDQEPQPIDAQRAADIFFKQVANLLKQKERIDGLTRPTILFHVSGGTGESLDILGKISSRSYNKPNLKAENITLDATFSLTDQTLVTNSSILFEADSVELPKHNTRAHYVTARFERKEWEALLKGEWPDMEVVADTLSIEDIDLESPRINIRPEAFPEIAFDGLTKGLRGTVNFSGSVNVNTRAANVSASGSIDLMSIAPETMTDQLPTIRFNRAPYYNLDLSFNEGLALEEAKLRARVDALDVERLQFDHIRFRGSYRDGIYSINKLYLRRDWQWLDLGFSLDSPTNDYAVTLHGFAKPYDYNAILPRWWGGIFQDFDFEQIESGLGDFVIYGNTQSKAADFFFGHARTRNVAYAGVRVDEGELFVRGRGPYAEVYKLDVRRGEGFARGNIRFASRLDEVRGPMSVRLDLDTKLPLSDAKKLFDKDIAKVLSEFDTDAMPRAILKGAIFNKSYPEFNGLSYIDITATCPSPLRYKSIPLDYLEFDLFGRVGVTHLRDIQLGYAGGKVDADADIITSADGPAMTRFELSLKGANQTQAVRQLTALKRGSSGEPGENDTVSEGILDFELAAYGQVDDPFAMSGFGNLEIENDNLYAIQLFGPLSRLLQKARLGFTSFALNKLEAQFALKDGTVEFSQLEINGPKTRIEAPGTLQLSDFSLAMRVSVYLFGNAGNPNSNIRRIGDLITKPIPNLLEFELTGTTEDQKWRSLYDPRNLIPIF